MVEQLDRHALLGSVAAGTTVSLAGCSLFESGADGSVTKVTGEQARSLADRFAPIMHFDHAERWFQTDPRRYESGQDGDTVVDGFDALNGYVDDGGHRDPPAPTVFYQVLAYESSPLASVQFWFYKRNKANAPRLDLGDEADMQRHK